MLIVMKSDASESDIARVIGVVEEMGFSAHRVDGATRCAIAVTGNQGTLDNSRFEHLKGVAETIKGVTGAGNKGSKGGDMNRPHKAGLKVQADPSNPGGAGATPSAMAQGGQEGGPDIQKLLAMLAQMQGQGGGGQPPPM